MHKPLTSKQLTASHQLVQSIASLKAGALQANLIPVFMAKKVA